MLWVRLNGLTTTTTEFNYASALKCCNRLFPAFFFIQGLPQRMIFLRSVLFSMSFSLARTSIIYSFTTSRNLLLVFPFFLFPGNSISIIPLPIYSWSLLMICPYHLILFSLIFIPNRSTLTVPLIYSFLILFFVTPIENLNIFISVTSISSTCFFVTAIVSSIYTIADVTTVLCTFLFTLVVTSCHRLFPILFSIRSILL